MKNLTISKALAYANKYYDEKGLRHALRVADYVEQDDLIVAKYKNDAVVLAIMHDLIEDTKFMDENQDILSDDIMIIFAMGRLAGYLSPYEMAQRESIYIKVFNAGVDLVDFEKLVSAFITYTPMTVDQLAKTIHKPFEETKFIVQKLTDAGIIYTPEVKIGQDTYYLLKNGACYVNIEEQMKYTPGATVQENGTSKDTGVDFFEER